MGKSLPRMCRACRITIKSDFNKHITKVCSKKHEFQGWVYFNRDGRIVQEDTLPHRETRVPDGKKGIQIGSLVRKAEDVDA